MMNFIQNIFYAKIKTFRMKKETQTQLLQKILNYAFACRNVAMAQDAEGDYKAVIETMKEMKQCLLATFKISRKKK
jgi:hypothetical protein